MTMLALVAATLAWIFGAGAWSAALGGPLILLFMGLEWKRLARVAKVLALASGAVVILVAGLGKLTLAGLVEATDRAMFLTAFVTVLGFLQSAARSSPMIRRCGHVLVHQPPGRRYLVLTSGGALFGMLLNLGGVNLLANIVQQGVEANRPTAGDRIADIRLKRMSLAILRGFATVPMWSPVAVTLVILLSSMPDLKWAQIAPYGICLSLAYLGLGWAVDRLTYPAPSRGAASGRPEPLTPLLNLVVLAVALPGGALAVSSLLSISLISGLVLIVPVFSILWIFLQMRGTVDRPLARTWGRLRHVTLPSLSEMHSEIGIFAASSFIGVLLAPVVDVEATGEWIRAIGLNSGSILMLAFWFIAGLGMLGLNPILTVTIAVEVLPHIPDLDMDPLTVAIMATCSWAWIVNSGPFAASTRMLGRIIGHEPGEIAMRWNGSYCVALFVLLSAGLLAFG